MAKLSKTLVDYAKDKMSFIKFKKRHNDTKIRLFKDSLTYKYPCFSIGIWFDAHPVYSKILKLKNYNYDTCKIQRHTGKKILHIII